MLIILLMCVSTMITYENEVAMQYTYDYQKKNLEYEIELERSGLKDEINSYSYMATTKSKKAWSDNEIAWKKWYLKEKEELFELLKKNGAEDEAYKEKKLKLDTISNFAEFNYTALPNEGSPTIEDVFPEEVSYYSSLYGMDELPFDLEKLSQCPYYGEKQKKSYLAEIDLKIEMYRGFFKQLSLGKDAISIYSYSPYSFLSRLFCLQQMPSIIFGGILILFSAASVAESKRNESYRLISIRPQRKKAILWHYYRSNMVVTALAIIVIIGVFFLLYGVKGGFGGLEQTCYVIPHNFTSFQVCDPHLDSWRFLGIEKIFYNVELDNSPYDPILLITQRYSCIPMWQFLLASAVLAILKWLFFVVVGTGIGIIFKKNSRIVISAAFVTGLYSLSQFTTTKTNWNPFAVKAAWHITTGIGSITWFHAVCLMCISIILWIVINIIIMEKRDII